MEPYEPPQLYVPRPQRNQSEYAFRCDCGMEFGSHAAEGICPGCGKQFSINPPHGSLAIVTPERPRGQYESTKAITKAVQDQARLVAALRKISQIDLGCVNSLEELTKAAAEARKALETIK